MVNNIPKEDEIPEKSLQKLKDQYSKLNQKLKEQDKTFSKNLEELTKLYDQKLEDGLLMLNQKLSNQINNIESNFNTLLENMEVIKNQIASNTEQIQVQLKTQEEIIMDMIHKFNEQMLDDKTKLNSDIEQLKNNQDVFKINIDTLEKRVLETVESMIYSEVRMACRNKEKEILMNLWINELKEIISNLDKLKEMHPKDLKIYIDEISRTVESFKKKLIK
ncbi:MAG: hypothetical protein ACFFAH_12160 [Promethearchaeota archaeon]